MESVFHTTRSDGWREPTDIVSRKPPEFFFNARSQRPVGPVAQPDHLRISSNVIVAGRRVDWKPGTRERGQSSIC